jgi:hypothetical protein
MQKNDGDKETIPDSCRESSRDEKLKINCFISKLNKEITVEVEKLKSLKHLKKVIKEEVGLEKTFKVIYKEKDISGCGKLRLKDLFLLESNTPESNCIKLVIAPKLRKSKTTTSEKRLKYMLECPTHLAENAHFYCFNCKISICTLCLEDHHIHDYIDKYDYSKSNEDIVNSIMEEFLHSLTKMSQQVNSNKEDLPSSDPMSSLDLFSHMLNQMSITDKETQNKSSIIIDKKLDEVKSLYQELLQNNELLLRDKSLAKIEDFKKNLLKFKMICHNSLSYTQNKKIADIIVLEEEYFLEIHKTLKDLDAGKKALIKYMQTLNKNFLEDMKSFNDFQNEIKGDLEKIIEKMKNRLKCEDISNISKCEENLNTSTCNEKLDEVNLIPMRLDAKSRCRADESSEYIKIPLGYGRYNTDTRGFFNSEISTSPSEILCQKSIMKRRIGMDKKPADIILYDSIKKKFEIRKINAKEEMNFKKFLPFSVFLNMDNILYISGGKRKNGKCVNDFYSFNPDKDELIKLPNMLKERCSHSMINYNSSIIVVGGYSNNTCEKFINNKWEKLPDLNFKERQVPTLYIHNYDNLLCAFGYINGELENADYVEKLNLKNPTKWDLIKINHNFSQHELKLFNVGIIPMNMNEFLVCGGEHYQGEEKDDIYMLQVEGDKINLKLFESLKLPLKCSFIDKNFVRYTGLKFAQYEMKKNNLIIFNSAECKFKSKPF